MAEKIGILKEYLTSLESVAVAFSGGVDSTFLLKIAHDVLGDKAIAVTISSDLIPKRELEEAENFCRLNNITQIICEVNELEIPGFGENPKNRCYICKKYLFTKILEIARKHKISNVIEGSNIDDLSDYRPGMKAIEELEIKSPLKFAGFTKSDIREFSQKLNLPTWNKPSFACLASRFVYGEEITKSKLKMIAQAEELLLNLGFKQFRVRLHKDIARIEILTEDFALIVRENIRKKIYDELKLLGFSYITLDLKGYRTGSMNETV